MHNDYPDELLEDLFKMMAIVKEDQKRPTKFSLGNKEEAVLEIIEACLNMSDDPEELKYMKMLADVLEIDISNM